MKRATLEQRARRRYRNLNFSALNGAYSQGWLAGYRTSQRDARRKSPKTPRRKD